MNKFEIIENKLLEYTGSFSHWNIDNLLNKKPSSNLDSLISDLKLEEEAKELFINIEPELEGYFLSIIEKIDFELIKRNSLNRYNNDVEKVKRNFLNSQVDEQIKILEFSIVEKRNKHSLFIDIYNISENIDIANSNKLKPFIAKKSAEFYQKKKYDYKGTINKVTNYLLDLADFIFYNTIFHHLNQPRKATLSFKDLFESEELYKKAVNILIENNFIKKDENKLKWIFTSTKKFTTKQTIIALCVVLEIKHYFKYNPKTIYKNIKNEFNITMNKSTYSRSSSGFKDDYTTVKTKNSSYISLFKDIL